MAYNGDIESISKGFGMQLSTFRRKKMKKQALAIAIASALVAPSAFAAQDTSGMHYTSASEGFYASIRTRFETGGKSHHGSNVGNSSSRIGVSGTNDLGGGLEGFYGWELGVDVDNGGDTSVRLGNVGLRGPFGSFWVGSNWAADYNWTHGSTDIANVASGNLDYTANRPGRTSNAVEYTTPDLNGFQGAVRLNMTNSGTDNDDGSADKTDNNDIDAWNVAANYAVQGFSVAGAYNVRPDGLNKYEESNYGGDPAGKDDANSWTFKLGYAQDNWYVNGWYGEDNTSDAGYNAGTPGTRATPRIPGMPAIPSAGIPAIDEVPAADQENGEQGTKSEDTTFFSIGGGVSVDKVNLYALYDQREDSKKRENSWGTIGAQYNLGSRSRVWIEYVTRDLDTDANADDNVNIGMRHDF